MRMDAGINGDAQHIEQMVWMLFLKVYDAKEDDWELNEDNYTSIIPDECRWRNWAQADDNGHAMTGDKLLNFVNNTLFPTLKELPVTPDTPVKKAIVKSTFEDANNYMKDGVYLRQVIDIIDEIEFDDVKESHAFGFVYEEILRDLQAAGSSGEFYTPRAVTDFMALMIQPKLGEKMAEMLLTILSSLSQEESRSISENVKWGQRKKFSDGRFSMCYGLFLGYDKGMVINEEQAKTIEFIYSEFIMGLSPKAIAKKLTELGYETPGGQKKWYEGTVRSILKNEKYKGCALLQKTYTPDFLTKKSVKNDGKVPQFFVEDSHPAIIDPDQFELVQDIFEERAREPKHSGATIFSGKIRCGCCGGWYGSKVWHSNDKYRRVIWQCNAKFKDKTRCQTPHLTEDEVKAAFVRMVNKLGADRDFYITELAAIKDRLSDTTELEKEKRLLDQQLAVDAKAVDDLIAQNARKAQNQTEYRERYDALVSRYEETEKKRDAVADQISQRMVRRRKLERFIETVKALPELYTEFDKAQWSGLVDSMTVHSKDKITFTLTSGMEIEA